MFVRFPAADSKTTYRPSLLMSGLALSASPNMPSGPTLSRVTRPSRVPAGRHPGFVAVGLDKAREGSKHDMSPAPAHAGGTCRWRRQYAILLNHGHQTNGLGFDRRIARRDAVLGAQARQFRQRRKSDGQPRKQKLATSSLPRPKARVREGGAEFGGDSCHVTVGRKMGGPCPTSEPTAVAARARHPSPGGSKQG